MNKKPLFIFTTLVTCALAAPLVYLHLKAEQYEKKHNYDLAVRHYSQLECISSIYTHRKLNALEDNLIYIYKHHSSLSESYSHVQIHYQKYKTNKVIEKNTLQSSHAHLLKVISYLDTHIRRDSSIQEVEQSVTYARSITLSEEKKAIGHEYITLHHMCYYVGRALFGCRSGQTEDSFQYINKITTIHKHYEKEMSPTPYYYINYYGILYLLLESYHLLCFSTDTANSRYISKALEKYCAVEPDIDKLQMTYGTEFTLRTRMLYSTGQQLYTEYKKDLVRQEKKNK